MSAPRWGSLPILDAFRPEVGWKTDHAVLGTYSADPVALVAVLLALAGRDNDRGSGTPVDVADAIEELRGRVAFLIQTGRISVPFRAPTALKVLDNFVREVQCDESVESWHPKVALIRQMREEDGAPFWRFWMGSRNLTRDRSRDAGLLLVGTGKGDGMPVPGLIETAKELWSRARLRRVDQAKMIHELRRVRWVHPQGCKVEEIQFLLPRTRERSLPPEPRRIDSLLVVSPFLDGGTIKSLGKWGDNETERTLLSTQHALSGLAKQKGNPLRRFSEVLHMPDFDEDEDLFLPGVSEASEEGSEESEEDPAGLHAKLILAQNRGKGTLWLGSPNATARAWEKNYEIVARLSVQEELAGDLVKFAKGAHLIDFDAMEPELVSPENEAIEEARRQVVSRWHDVHQKNWALHAKTPPHPDHPKVALQVGILGGELVKWPRKTKMLRLRKTEPLIETELVQVRISLGKFQRRWLQKTPLNPPPGMERDRRAVATMLTPRTFLKWLRELLDEDVPQGGESWDTEPVKRANGGDLQAHQTLERLIPSLEDVLKAWTRRPGVLKVVDIRLKAYMDFIRSSPGKETEELGLLEEFQKIWKIIRRELLEQE